MSYNYNYPHVQVGLAIRLDEPEGPFSVWKSVKVGDTVRLRAGAKDRKGRPLPTQVVIAQMTDAPAWCFAAKVDSHMLRSFLRDDVVEILPHVPEPVVFAVSASWEIYDRHFVSDVAPAPKPAAPKFCPGDRIQLTKPLHGAAAALTRAGDKGVIHSMVRLGVYFVRMDSGEDWGAHEDALELQPESKFGFTVGETVNIVAFEFGDRPGKVVGFQDQTVCVQWPGRQPVNIHFPDRLRHGP